MVALTEKVWEPAARPVYDLGDVQALKAPLSMLHSNVARLLPGELNAKAAEDPLITFEVIVVSGAVAIVVQVQLPTAAPEL